MSEGNEILLHLRSLSVSLNVSATCDFAFPVFWNEFSRKTGSRHFFGKSEMQVGWIASSLSGVLSSRSTASALPGCEGSERNRNLQS